MNGAFDITRLFVGDLASHCDEANIEALFKQHGIDVVNVKLMRGKNSLASLNYGFVQVSRREDAEKAIAELDSMLFLGRNIKVKHATQNHGAKQNRSTLTQSTNSIFVKFRALEIGIYVTEETLRNLFSSFGDVTDVSIKASNILGSPRDLESGYGFVHFSSSEEGINMCFKAMDVLAGDPVVGGVEYTCEASQNLLRSIHEMKKRQTYINKARRNQHGPNNNDTANSQPYCNYEHGRGDSQRLVTEYSYNAANGYSNQRVVGQYQSFPRDEFGIGLTSKLTPRSVSGMHSIQSLNGSHATGRPNVTERLHGSPLSSRIPTHKSHASEFQFGTPLTSRITIDDSHSYVPDRSHRSPLTSLNVKEHSHATEERLHGSPLTNHISTIYSNDDHDDAFSRYQNMGSTGKDATPVKLEPSHISGGAMAPWQTQGFSNNIKVSPNKFVPNIHATEYTPGNHCSQNVVVSQPYDCNLQPQLLSTFPYNFSGEYAIPTMQLPTLTPSPTFQTPYTYSMNHHQPTPDNTEFESHQREIRSMPYFQVPHQENTQDNQQIYLQADPFAIASRFSHPTNMDMKQRTIFNDESNSTIDYTKYQSSRSNDFMPNRPQFQLVAKAQTETYNYYSSVEQQKANSRTFFEPEAISRDNGPTISYKGSAKSDIIQSRALIVGNEDVVATSDKEIDSLAGPGTVVSIQRNDLDPNGTTSNNY